jgi:TPP-dependent pyruvate/acetoin dehydrogenase alpha subunit
MPAARIDDGDVFKIYAASIGFIDEIRKGNGPAFIECLTCRWKEHVGPNDDFALGYRTIEEVDCWKKDDQLTRLRGMLDEDSSHEIEKRVDKQIESAFEFAERSPFPGKDELLEDLFNE